jgi:cytochrome b561
MASQSTPPQRVNSAFKQFRLIHWLMAIAYLILVVLGLLMSKVFNTENTLSTHDFLYVLHSSLSVLAIAALSLRIIYLLRISWKKYSRHLPRFTLTWFRAAILHIFLYILMWSVPMSGLWLVNSTGSHNVSLFKLIPVPDIFPANPDNISTAYELHERFAYLIIALSLFHIFEQRKTAMSMWKRTFQRQNS